MERLEEIFPKDRIFFDIREITAYCNDASVYFGKPSVIVKPVNDTEVSNTLLFSIANRIPIVARGAGTSLCGQCTAIPDCIMVDFSLMNNIIKISPENRYAIVQPGVIYEDLNTKLLEYGFSFPPCPGSSSVATIGGMVAVNASGINSFKYGATRDYVLGMTFFTGTAEKIETGGAVLKDASSYQLSRFLVGSEGSLGLITSITLKIVPASKSRGLLRCMFSELDDAGVTIAEIIASGITPVGIELLDKVCLDALKNSINFNTQNATAMLFIPLDGCRESMKNDIEILKSIIEKRNPIDLEYTTEEKEIDYLYSVRKSLIPSLSRYKRGYSAVMLADDLSIPPAVIPEFISKIHAASNDLHDMRIAIYGHAADGNLHTRFLFNPSNENSWKECSNLARKIYVWIREMNGLISGEHGVGYSKQEFIDKNNTAVKLMRDIKKTFDPYNILNPNKFLDERKFEPSIRYLFRDDEREETEIESDSCVMCGFCKEVCPAYKLTLLESISPRGQIICQRYQKMAESDKEKQDYASRFYDCTLCFACSEKCPSKINAPLLIQKAREENRKKGYKSEASDIIFNNIKMTGNLYAEELQVIEEKQKEFLLYLGCRYILRKKELNAGKKILKYLGMETFLTREICCGYPFIALGNMEDFFKQKEKLLKIIDNRSVITFCPTCTMTLNNYYDVKASHIISIIYRNLDKLNFTQKTSRITWHDPCHLSRSLKIIEEPRMILEKTGAVMIEMKHNGLDTMCCGGGGGLMASNEKLSVKISEARIEEAIETEAEYLVTFCSTCEHMLRQASQNNEKSSLKIRNLLDYIGGFIQ
ncbi:MAG: FAD-binding oxidoreductase [Candidatus Coatesbacteria bacterium]|nr:FAD-binding oxidoreductase [Candidatus Coatesbacteria bacterium]